MYISRASAMPRPLPISRHTTGGGSEAVVACCTLCGRDRALLGRLNYLGELPVLGAGKVQ